MVCLASGGASHLYGIVTFILYLVMYYSSYDPFFPVFHQTIIQLRLPGDHA